LDNRANARPDPCSFLGYQIVQIAGTSTNLITEKIVVYGATEGRFGSEIASKVAFGMASVEVKARGYLCSCEKDVGRIDGNEKGGWYRSGHGGQIRKAGD
jgi:hypothetical protein